MSSNISMSRAAVAGVLLVGLVATSGCSWFRKSDELYAPSPANRALEVPPDLDQPRTDAGMAIPGSATASGTVAAAAAAPAGATASASAETAGGAGFVVSGTRDEVFAKVESALAEVEGLTVASRAQLLGAFDVNYQDINFLVRVSEAEAGAYVSAVDPRGLPAAGPAPAQLIATLKAALGGH